MITTELKSTEYIGGKRVDTVAHTYTIADDFIRLGQLYYSLGQKLQGVSDEKDISALQKLIDAQIEMIKGYGDVNASGNTAE